MIDAWLSWRGRPRHDWRLVVFGCLLCLAGTGWVLTSAALITALSPAPINGPMDFLLLLDRQVSVLQAVTASWRVVLRNPGVMACWAALIAGLSMAGLALFLLGSLVVVPVLGHASWHAYRDAVDADALPARVRGSP